MPKSAYMPHIDLLLAGLRVGRERLAGRGKIAVDGGVLRALIQLAVERQPFSDSFYRETYPDIAAAYAAGAMPDLHRHFVSTGYFEGRAGASPPVDEAYYIAAYPDVARALACGEVASAAEHYLRSGAAEGRAPNAATRPDIEGWMALLQQPPERR